MRMLLSESRSKLAEVLFVFFSNDGTIGLEPYFKDVSIEAYWKLFGALCGSNFWEPFPCQHPKLTKAIVHPDILHSTARNCPKRSKKLFGQLFYCFSSLHFTNSGPSFYKSLWMYFDGHGHIVLNKFVSEVTQYLYWLTLT